MEKIKMKPEAIRITLDMKQSEFAKALGLDVRTYHNRLSGRTEWKGCELALLAQLAGITIDQIEF